MAGNRWAAILQNPRIPLTVVVIAIVADIMLFVRPHTAGDVGLYHLYAQDFWFGSRPFHLLPVEYPALALAIFTLTLIPPVLDYATVFAIWTGIALAVGLWAIYRISPQSLIWFLPLVAIVEVLRWRWIVICALTSVVYPFLYLFNVLSSGAPNGGFYGPLFAGTIAVRNGLLIYALVRVVRPSASRLRITAAPSTRDKASVAVRLNDRDDSSRGS